MSNEVPRTEERRQELIEQIRVGAREAGFPDFDVESKLAGHLAGPASENRPDVPVWQYLEYMAANPTVTIEEVAQIRFPVTFYGGNYSPGLRRA